MWFLDNVSSDNNSEQQCLWCCHHALPLWEFTWFIWWV